MKRLLISTLLILGFLAQPLFAIDSVYERSRPHEVDGWHVSVEDRDIDINTPELITERITTYAQLAAEDTIEVLSSSASDITQTVTVTGIDNAGNKVSDDIVLNTTTGTTAVESSVTFRYIDQSSLDIECEGVVTIRRATGDTFITSIPIGDLEAGMLQHFNGQYNSYITNWSVTTKATSAVKFELRWYPDDADSLDSGDGYKVLDRITTGATGDTIGCVGIVQPIKCPLGGWIAVFGAGTTNNQVGSVVLQGYDSKN